MEDALARWQFFENLGRTYCLNPCFNGRCTRTSKAKLLTLSKES